MVKESSDSYSIFTKVKVGKSFKSKGWALNRKDIRDLIPTDKYEGQCHINIAGINAPARLRVNPRLFYHSKELSKYLEELSQSDSNQKVPMEIKLKKEHLYSNFINKYLNSKPIEYFDLELPVGKSFSSKGWRLNNDITSAFIPLENYSYTYEINVEGISSTAILDVQTRIFYKSKKLSDYLKKLYDINPNQKINARIIFDEDLMIYDLFNKYGNNLKSDISEEENFINNETVYFIGDNHKILNESKGDESVDLTILENSFKLSNSFKEFLISNFKRSTYAYVNFDLNKNNDFNLKSQVFYSNSDLFFSILPSKNILRFVLGKSDSISSAKKYNNPLMPSFIFDFTKEGHKSSFEAIFVKLDEEVHLMSKIYDFPLDILNQFSDEFPFLILEDFNFALLDFGPYLEGNEFYKKFEKNMGFEFKLNDSNQLTVNMDSIKIDIEHPIEPPEEVPTEPPEPPIKKDPKKSPKKGSKEDPKKVSKKGGTKPPLEISGGKCPICRKKLIKNVKKDFLETYEEYPYKCNFCLERIFTLEHFNLFKEKSLTNFVIKDHIKQKVNLENFDFVWDLFIKHEMLEQIGSSFKLVGNAKIEEKYGPILKKDDEPKPPRLILPPTGDSRGGGEDIVSRCIVCGKELAEDEYEKCSQCYSKDFAKSEIKNALRYFTPTAKLYVDDIPEEEFPLVKRKMLISSLLDNDIIHKDSDDIYSLDFDSLISFIKKNGSVKNNIIFDSINNDLNIIFLPNFALSNEELLDSYVNWDDFEDYVSFKKSFSTVRITFKKSNNTSFSETERDFFSAKMAAVLYLKKLGMIRVLNKDEIKKYGISRF